VARSSKGKQSFGIADLGGGAAIEIKIEHIRSLGQDELRTAWRKAFGKDVPEALSRNIQVRLLTWNIQEKALGGHDRATLKILNSYAKGRPPNVQIIRRLKPGTELVREYQGECHTVTIVAEGFRWRNEIYPSLSAIARAITGSVWNGPRFFGLRKVSEGRKPPSGIHNVGVKAKGTPVANFGEASQ
jgi:hypothetical protein